MNIIDGLFVCVIHNFRRDLSVFTVATRWFVFKK